MFLGTYSPRLDDKGRIAFPAKYREDLTAGVVVTRGQEHCLYVFPRADFARRAADLMEAKISVRGNRQAMRMYAAGAHDDVPDKQGRITLPAPLRRYAGLERDVVVVGALSHLEIWDAEAWERYQSETEAAFADLDEEEVLPHMF